VAPAFAAVLKVAWCLRRREHDDRRLRPRDVARSSRSATWREESGIDWVEFGPVTAADDAFQSGELVVEFAMFLLKVSRGTQALEKWMNVGLLIARVVTQVLDHRQYLLAERGDAGIA
jgi:hypothetical protein